MYLKRFCHHPVNSYALPPARVNSICHKTGKHPAWSASRSIPDDVVCSADDRCIDCGFGRGGCLPEADSGVGPAIHHEVILRREAEVRKRSACCIGRIDSPFTDRKHPAAVDGCIGHAAVKVPAAVRQICAGLCVLNHEFAAGGNPALQQHAACSEHT